MKIWIKSLAAIVLGIILGLVLPQKVIIINDIVKILSEVAINILLYFSILYVLVKSFLGIMGLKINKIPFGKNFALFILMVLGSLFFSAVVSLGLMNLAPFQPGDSFTIFQNQSLPLQIYRLDEIIQKIISRNIFESLFNGETHFFLPILFISIIFALSAFSVGKKGSYFVELVESFDAVMSKVVQMFIEIFPFVSIFLVVYLFRGNDFDQEKIKFLGKPLMAVLVVSGILFVFYTLFLYFILKGKVGSFYLGILGACLTGLLTGNTAASIITANEHIKKNLGVKKEFSDVFTPFGMVINRSGTIVISVIAIMTLVLGYSPNILTLKFQIQIFLMILMFSFILDGVNQYGFLALVSMIMHLPFLHLEQDSYLLFMVFIPILSRIGMVIDIFTTAIFVVFTAKINQLVEKKEYIDYI